MPAYIKAKGGGKKTELVKDKLYINGKLFTDRNTGVTTQGDVKGNGRQKTRGGAHGKQRGDAQSNRRGR